MIAQRCDICWGRREINLPVHQPLSVDGFAGPFLPTVTSRKFPCPQCGPTVPEERVRIITHGVEYPVHAAEMTGAMDHIKSNAARALIDRMMRNGMIKFEEMRPGTLDPLAMVRIRATLAAVTPAHVETMEQRIAQRQTDVAIEAAEIAAAEITNWGSQFGCTEIEKSRAIEFVRESAGMAIRRRTTAWKPA